MGVGLRRYPYFLFAVFVQINLLVNDIKDVIKLLGRVL